MSNAILVIGILILVAVLFFGYTALAKKYLNEEKEENKTKKIIEIVLIFKTSFKITHIHPKVFQI